MALVVSRTVRLLLGAGSAKPGPAIGQSLGPLGLNMAEFCKQFNEATKAYDKDTPVPVILSAYTNRSFTFECKTPPTSWFLKKCAGITKGAGRTGHETIGKVHVKQIYEIAKIKKGEGENQYVELEKVCRMIMGSAKTMGIEVVNK